MDCKKFLIIIVSILIAIFLAFVTIGHYYDNKEQLVLGTIEANAYLTYLSPLKSKNKLFQNRTTAFSFHLLKIKNYRRENQTNGIRRKNNVVTVNFTLETDIYIGYFIKYTMQGRPPVS